MYINVVEYHLPHLQSHSGSAHWLLPPSMRAEILVADTAWVHYRSALPLNCLEQLSLLSELQIVETWDICISSPDISSSPESAEVNSAASGFFFSTVLLKALSKAWILLAISSMILLFVKAKVKVRWREREAKRPLRRVGWSGWKSTCKICLAHGRTHARTPVYVWPVIPKWGYWQKDY